MNNTERNDFFDKNYRMNVKWKMGIKWKMITMLVIFIVCVLVSIWFVQVQMLNFFYQNAKFYELEQSADIIVNSLGDERESAKIVFEQAEEHYFDIWVLEIKGDKAEWLIEVNGSDSNALQFKTNKIKTLYGKAVDNGGKYIATVPVDQFMGDFSIEVLEDNLGNKDAY
ncbi:MAG: hypothetical protein IJY08_01750, partial [Clostridia bacterium]|nr:hypothetical protein [Clostridia bacterium]